MNEVIGRLFSDMRHKLASLGSRMESLESNVEATWRPLHEKLDEARARTDASEENFARGRSALMQWYEHQRIEMIAMQSQWEFEHTPQESAQRAIRAERHLQIAIRLAEISLEEVERMILETIAARQMAETLAHS